MENRGGVVLLAGLPGYRRRRWCRNASPESGAAKESLEFALERMVQSEKEERGRERERGKRNEVCVCVCVCV